LSDYELDYDSVMFRHLIQRIYRHCGTGSSNVHNISVPLKLMESIFRHSFCKDIQQVVVNQCIDMTKKAVY